MYATLYNDNVLFCVGVIVVQCSSGIPFGKLRAATAIGQSITIPGWVTLTISVNLGNSEFLSDTRLILPKLAGDGGLSTLETRITKIALQNIFSKLLLRTGT